ncbi:MAG: tetratricopeptide repeat protein [Thermoanaerobaculaceae bacterium]|nr:tetratricopeptide repeat protein [Thermoanaerobaculaceae bacterium]
MASLPALCGHGSFRVGEWAAYPSLNQLVRGEFVVRLRPKVMDVLAHLASRPGDVVSKDEILDAVWAKKFLGDTALSRAVFELREALGDDPQHPVYVETIPKRGYRLVASVQPLEAAPLVAVPGAPEPRARSRARAAAAAVGVVVAVAAGVLAMGRIGPFRSATAPVNPKKIVVLPFENLGAPDDAYFAAGVTDEITNRLVSVQEISVISRGSAENYAGSKLGQREIGRELGVDFVLGGAVRWERGAAGRNRVRITPRLVRVADDTQVWASVYDRVLEDIFSVQSEIARSVIAEVGIALQGPARSAVDRRPTANLEAYQAFLRGRYQAANIYRSEQDLRLGLRMFERAVALDPGFAVAWAETARVRAMLHHVGFDRTDVSRNEARRALDRALSLDAASASIHFDAALYHYWFNRDYPRALAEFALARKAGGDTAGLLSAEGYLFRRQGRWEEALKTFEAAARLDPRGWTVLRELGTTSLYMGRYADAERHLEQAIALAPDEADLYGFLAETYWTWRADTGAAEPVLRAMPKSLEPRQVRWRFWQEVYRGDLGAALDRLQAGSFDVIDSSENWESRGLLLARVYRMLGRTDDARREFEQVRAEMERLLGQRADDPSLHSTLGLCLAGLGRNDDAVREGRRAVELVALRHDSVAGPGMALALAEVYTMVGEPESACAVLESTLAKPAAISAARLRMDPTWAPLRSQPCFAALLAKPRDAKGETRESGAS